MAFGQSSGPPATGSQLRELLELLQEAGHSDFRDARGPMGFTQRQAGGKFTAPEADEFIEQLQTQIHGDGPPPGTRPAAASRAARPTPKKKAKPAAGGSSALSEIPTEVLAAELQLRGWIVAEP